MNIQNLAACQPAEESLTTTCDAVEETPDGIVTTNRFRPTDKVWTFVNNKACETTVLHINIKHRSLTTSRCHLDSRIVYVMAEGGIERLDSEVFATKEELKNSI